MLARAPGVKHCALDRHWFRRPEAELGADANLDRLENDRVVFEELLDVLAPLAEAIATVGEPGAALFDDLPFDRQVEQVPLLRDPLAVHDVELRFAERRRDLVLDDL